MKNAYHTVQILKFYSTKYDTYKSHAELARVRQRTETETRAAHASHVASLELDLTELRSALATHEGAAKKRETELMLQRDEALGQVAALKRELIALSELRDKAERARREIETRYQTAAEVSTAAKATEERATAEAAQLRTESATLRAQLDTESAQRSAVESELIKVQSQVQLLTNSMAKAITDRDAMAQRLKEAEYRVRLYPILPASLAAAIAGLFCPLFPMRLFVRVACCMPTDDVGPDSDMSMFLPSSARSFAGRRG